VNSLERVMATIKGEAVDRRAVGGVLCMYGAKLTGCNLETYYNKPERYLEGQIAVVETFEPDIIISPLCVAHEARAFGCEVRYFSNNPPNIIKRAIANSSEIRHLKIPDINTDPNLLYIRNSIRLLTKQYHAQIPIAAVWMDPMDMLANAIGVETFMDLMIFHKAEFDEVMIKIGNFCVEYGNAMLEDGADILVNFGSLCNTAMISRVMAENIVQPLLTESYSKLKGGILFHAGGYKIEPYIDIYKNLPNLIGFIIDSRDQLVKARIQAGSDLVIAGNIEGPTLDIRTPEQISKISDYMLSTMKSDKHYMLSTSAADIPYAASIEQIKTFMMAPRLFAERG
jgi:uroporphyrinogen decarboxylase